MVGPSLSVSQDCFHVLAQRQALRSADYINDGERERYGEEEGSLQV